MNRIAAAVQILSSPAPARRRLLLLVFLAIWGVASVLAIRSGDALRYPDEKDYHNLAVSLMTHHGFLDEHLQPTAQRPPGYPFALTAIYSVWNRPLAAKLVNALACAVVALLLAALTATLEPAGGPGTVLAPILVLGYPLFLYTSSTLYPQIPGTLLLVICLFLLVRYTASTKAAITAGLLFGWLVLAIPSFLLWLPVFPIYLCLADRRNGVPLFRRAVLFLVCSALAITPWTIRNYIQLHALVAVSTNGGSNLLLGNSPNTTADSGVNVDLSEYMRQAEGLGEVEKDNFFKRCATEYIKQNPVAAVSLYFRKVLNYFNYRNRMYVQSESSTTRDLILFLTYYPLLFVALIRLWFWRRFKLGLTEGFLYFLYFGNAFLSAIFFTRIRFRIPFDAILMVLVALFVSRLWSEAMARRPAVKTMPD